VFTLSECFDDEGEVEEAEEEDIELFEAGEDSAEAFESSKQPFDLVAFFVERAVICPGRQPMLPGALCCRSVRSAVQPAEGF
jgi:hypothetical protein